MIRSLQRVAWGSVLLVTLAGCSSVSTEPPHDWLIVPAAGMAAVTNGYLKIPALTAAVAAYAVVDPLAPNWVIREAPLGEDRYQLALRMKGIHTGGDGEARQVFARRAAQLAGQPGFGAYEVVAWQEGLDSTRPFSQRVAEGEIRLLRASRALAAMPPPATSARP
ncbi:MAG TPA: hypothetical protein PLL39_06100 [Rhodocyclaceae bacterium]|nr:hypothetical protein [Rhodocyclaceae bacterium]